MENNIQKQIYAAEKIKQIRCREWARNFKYFVPEYVTDYLFHKFGEVHRMLEFDKENGFMFDPIVLENGVDYLLRMVECVRRGEYSRAAIFYEKIAPDAESRIGYFWSFLDKLEVYGAVDKHVARDIEKCKQSQTDPEFIEILENRKRNVLRRGENEREEFFKKFSRQPN